MQPCFASGDQGTIVPAIEGTPLNPYGRYGRLNGKDKAVAARQVAAAFRTNAGMVGQTRPIVLQPLEKTLYIPAKFGGRSEPAMAVPEGRR